MAATETTQLKTSSSLSAWCWSEVVSREKEEEDVNDIEEEKTPTRAKKRRREPGLKRTEEE